MSIAVATFSAVAVSAAQDLFEIVAPSTRKVVIRELRFGQYSDPGDTEAELLSILIMRGHAITGSGGAAVTPAFLAHTGSPTLTSVIARNNTTVATTGTVVTLLADSFNVMGGFRYLPVPEERIELAPSARLVVRITAPSDALTMNGTMLFEELPIAP
jgi:hypothetical protein